MAHSFTITIRGSADSADAVSKVAADAATALKALGATVDAADTATQQILIAPAAPAQTPNQQRAANRKSALTQSQDVKPVKS